MQVAGEGSETRRCSLGSGVKATNLFWVGGGGCRVAARTMVPLSESAAWHKWVGIIWRWMERTDWKD